MELRSVDLILHLLVPSLTHSTLALSRVLGHRTSCSEAFRGTHDPLGTAFKASLWNAPGVRASLPSPPFLSWPLLFVLSGMPIRPLSSVHTLPFLPGPVPGHIPETPHPPPGRASLLTTQHLVRSGLWVCLPFGLSWIPPASLVTQHRSGRHTVPRTTQAPGGCSSCLSCGADNGMIKHSP